MAEKFSKLIFMMCNLLSLASSPLYNLWISRRKSFQRSSWSCMLDLNLVHGSHEQPGTRGITMEAVSPHAYGCDANEGPLGSIKRASDLWKWLNMIDAHIQLENSWKFKLDSSDRPDSVKPKWNQSLSTSIHLQQKLEGYHQEAKGCKRDSF